MTGSTERETGLAGRGSQQPPSPQRERGVDLVRAAALVRVIIFHASGNFIALTFIPAMPVMFFLGGTYVERSLRRRPAPQVVASRARRLAIPGFVYVLLGCIGLIVAGHSAGDVLSSLGQAIIPTHGGAGTTDHIADWLFSTLWYLRDYIALAALSPILSWVLRRWPKATFVAVVALLALGVLSGVADATAMYVAFWLLGMSHELTPFVQRMPRGLITTAAWTTALVGAAVLIVGGDGWTQPAGASLSGIGWLLGIELLREPLERVASRQPLQRWVSWFMNRAVSVYLWQMIPVVLLIRIVEPEGRSLHNAANALWIIPLSLIGTVLIASVFAPIERRAAKG